MTEHEDLDNPTEEELSEFDQEVQLAVDDVVNRIRDFDSQVARHKAGGQMFSSAPLVGVICRIRELMVVRKHAQIVCDVRREYGPGDELDAAIDRLHSRIRISR